jgi:ribosomal protein S18 acetylase RimI-like enzyme
MKFEKFTKDHKDILVPLYAGQKTLGTEYSLVTLLEWHKNLNLEAAVGEDYICFRLIFKGRQLYFPPVAANKARYEEALDELIAEGAKIFAEVTDATLPSFCKRNFRIEPDRDMAEYIYSSKSFRELSGKALHSKRNHIAQFQNAYRYQFAEYNKVYKNGILELLDRWINEKAASYDAPAEITSKNLQEEKAAFLQTAMQEKDVLLHVLDNLAFYRCFADVLLVDGKVIGISAGEILPTGVGAVYFEKADTSYIGSYTMLANLFARRHFEDVLYINRQEDTGDEGLRKAKLSYRPRYIYMKYIASAKEDSMQFSEDVLRLYRDSFPEDNPKTVDFFFNNIFSAKRLKTIRVDNKLVSALHIVPKTLDYLGRKLTLPYIVALATDKNYQKMGFATRLMEETLRCLKSQKTPFIALYPAIKGFYEKFGFVKVFKSDMDADAASHSAFRRIPVEDPAAIKAIFDQKSASYDVKIVRDFRQTELRLGTESGIYLLMGEDGTAAGYELTDSGGETSEIVLSEPAPQADADADKEKFIDNPDAPMGMARIADLDSAFALVALKNKYRFRLTDCFFEENNGVFEAYPGGILPGEGYDFILTERQLCALFFGYSVEGVPRAFIEEFPRKIFVPDKY